MGPFQPTGLVVFWHPSAFHKFKDPVHYKAENLISDVILKRLLLSTRKTFENNYKKCMEKFHRTFNPLILDKSAFIGKYICYYFSMIRLSEQLGLKIKIFISQLFETLMHSMQSKCCDSTSKDCNHIVCVRGIVSAIFCCCVDKKNSLLPQEHGFSLHFRFSAEALRRSAQPHQDRLRPPTKQARLYGGSVKKSSPFLAVCTIRLYLLDPLTCSIICH